MEEFHRSRVDAILSVPKSKRNREMDRFIVNPILSKAKKHALKVAERYLAVFGDNPEAEEFSKVYKKAYIKYVEKFTQRMRQRSVELRFENFKKGINKK